MDNYDSHVKPFIEQYGCDLFVLAFGMNDAGGAPRTIAATQKKILNRVLEQSPAAGLLIVSTMVPNPDATNGFHRWLEKRGFDPVNIFYIFGVLAMLGLALTLQAARASWAGTR